MKTTVKAALSALIVASPFLTSAARAASFASTYTRHDFQKCAERTSPEPGVIEVRVCTGHAGTPVMWTGEPDSGAVAFGKASDSDEPIPGLDTFHEARGTVEWRGPTEAGTVRPVAAIVRYDTGRAIGRLSSSRLVVYRLVQGGRSCVMGVVQGAASDANGAARALVDRHAKTFVCGRSRVIKGS